MESKKIVSGIKWASIQYALDVLFRLAIRLVLVKFLMPSEFGLVSMCIIFIAIANAASELGMSAALIQREDEEEVKLMYSTAFWTGLAWGGIVYLIMALGVGPFAAYFYDEPRLFAIVAGLSLSVVVKPVNMIHTVILTRDMNFKRIGRSLNSATLISGIIAIVLAYFGWGVWALVFNNVLTAVLPVPMLYMATKWLPAFEWKKDYFKQIFSFGVYSTGSQMFSTLTYNVDNLLIGKMLGSAPLGFYALSFSLTEQLRQTVSNVLNKVMYPVFSKNQSNDEKLRNYFLKIVNLNALIIYPLMTFTLIFAKDIIIGFFGEKWADSIMPLQILSVGIMIHLLVNSFTSLLRGRGKPHVEMKIIMFTTLGVLIPGLFLGISYFGLFGATIAILLQKIVLAIVGLVVLKRELNLPFNHVFVAIKTSLLGIVCAGVLVLLISNFVEILNIPILLMILFFLTYAAIVYKFEKDNLKQLFSKML